MKKSNNTNATKKTTATAKKAAKVNTPTVAAPVTEIETTDIVYDIADLNEDDTKVLRFVCDAEDIQTAKELAKAAADSFNYKTSIVTKSIKKLMAKGYLFENEGKVEINKSSLPEDFCPATVVDSAPASTEAITKVVLNVSAAPTKHVPYGQFGIHGKNIDLEGFTAGDRVKFQIKGVDAFGKYIHFHTNNHSPKGYAVIRGEDGKIYERVQNKFEAAPLEEVVAPAKKKAGKKKAAAEKEA